MLSKSSDDQKSDSVVTIMVLSQKWIRRKHYLLAIRTKIQTTGAKLVGINVVYKASSLRVLYS
jgi:hypothetical protein